MTYRKDAETVYVISWGDVVKVGYSAHKRWRYFELRGGNVLRRYEFRTFNDALTAEQAAHVVLCRRSVCPVDEAWARQMWRSTGGYRETAVVDDISGLLGELDEVVGAASVAMLASNATEQCYGAERALDPRTDGHNGLTKNRQPAADIYRFATRASSSRIDKSRGDR